MISLYIIKRVRAPPSRLSRLCTVPYVCRFAASATGRWLVVRCWSFFTRFFAPPTSVRVCFKARCVANKFSHYVRRKSSRLRQGKMRRGARYSKGHCYSVVRKTAVH